MNHEAPAEIQCLAILALPFITYGMMILGLEIGGLSVGYPGRGREIHEQIVNSIKQKLKGGKNKRKK